MYDLRSEVKDNDWVDRFAKDWREAVDNDAERALLAHVVKLTKSPSSCDQQDVDALRALGWSDAAIHDSVQVCSYFNYINRVAEGLGVNDEQWLDALGRG